MRGEGGGGTKGGERRNAEGGGRQCLQEEGRWKRFFWGKKAGLLTFQTRTTNVPQQSRKTGASISYKKLFAKQSLHHESAMTEHV